MNSDSDDGYCPEYVVGPQASPQPSSSPPATVAVAADATAARGLARNAVFSSPCSAAGVRAEQSPAGVAPPSSISLSTPAPTSGAAAPATTSGMEQRREGGLRLHAIKGRIRTVCLNPTGTILCAGGEDGQLCMWDFDVPLSSRRLSPTRVMTPFVNRISGLQAIISVHSSMDGSYFVACQDGDSPLVVGAHGKQLGLCAMGERGLVDVVRCKGHRAPVTSSSPHATQPALFLTCAQDGTARLWDSTAHERGSTYAVKHGSGQLMDTVVVESVLGLSASVGGGGSIFATGGMDGCVQLWDTRIKYRPGGALATWNVYALREAPSSSAVDHGDDAGDEDVFERHVGGLAELSVGGAPVLTVRTGSTVKLLDLRAPVLKPKSTGFLRCPPVRGLPCVTDTTPITVMGGNGGSSGSGDSFVTGTSRDGYRHVVGGHVIRFQVGDAAVSTDVWCAGRTDEDVLCTCASNSDISAEEPTIFAGLNTGDVVVRMGMGGSTPVERWLATRPVAVERTIGQKATREVAENDDDWSDNLF